MQDYLVCYFYKLAGNVWGHGNCKASFRLRPSFQDVRKLEQDAKTTLGAEAVSVTNIIELRNE